MTGFVMHGEYATKEEAVRERMRAGVTLDTRLEESGGKWRVLTRDPNEGHPFVPTKCRELHGARAEEQRCPLPWTCVTCGEDFDDHVRRDARKEHE